MDEQQIFVRAVDGDTLTVDVRIASAYWCFSPPDAEFAVRLLFEAYAEAGEAPFADLEDDVLYGDVPASALAVVSAVARTTLRNCPPGVPLSDLVEVAQARGRDDQLPIATYRIVVRDAAVLAPLRVGMEWWSSATSSSPTEEEFRFEGYSAWRKQASDVAIGARVAIGNMVTASAVGLSGAGRGQVRARREVTSRPRGWHGSTMAYDVALDVGGPRLWVFSEDMATPPDDAYESAMRDPRAFVDALLARDPLARADALRSWMLQEGGYHVVPLDDGTTLLRCCNGGVLLAVLQRLPFDEAFAVGVRLVHGWASDTAHHGLRYGVEVLGEGLTEGQSAMPYTWKYRCPIEVTLSELALLVAGEQERAPMATLADRARPADVALLRAALEQLSTLWMGNDPVRDAWCSSEYLVRALVAPPGRLPAEFREGFAHARSAAAAIGLPDGALVHPQGILEP